MGGGGGTSGKVSYPAFMVAAHDKIMHRLTDPGGWYDTCGSVSPYYNQTPYDPQDRLTWMTDSLSTFSSLINDQGPKYNAWAVLGTNLPIPVLAAFSGAFDTSFSTYGLATNSADSLYLDTDTYSNLDTIGWNNVTPDTWVDANEWGMTLDSWVPGTDYLSNTNIQGIYNTAYNAIMSRKTFTEQASLKGKFRNMGACATSAFPIAIVSIEKAAVQEAMQVVLSFLKDRNLLSVENQKNINAHTLEANRVLIAKRQVKHQVKDDQAKIGIASIAENVKIASLRHGVKADRSKGLIENNQVNLEVAKTKVEVNKIGAEFGLEKAKFNANLDIQEHNWTVQAWKYVNDYKVNVLSFWANFQDVALRLTSAIIAAKIDHKNQQIEFIEQDKLWHAEKYRFINQANASLSGGGSTAGTQKASKIQSALTGAMSGAAIGAAVSGPAAPAGAAVGAIIGGTAGYFA